MRKRFLFACLTVLAVLLVAIFVFKQDGNKPSGAKLVSVETTNPSGFARADRPREFNFPTDHGPHPDFQTEWWYYTGNLQTPEGRRFGYQLTFFRRALVPPEKVPARESGWSTPQVYMAHFALSDVQERTHTAFERLERGAEGLSGAQGNPFEVWLDNWQVTLIEEGVYRLQAAQEDIALDLKLSESKPPVLQGDQGYSRKGEEAGQASYYYSLTRLETSGELHVSDKSIPVSGYSWMDHEFSTSALSPDQVGWDWFALQFDDGTELMVFQIRREDGSVDPFSSGTWIAADGKAVTLNREDFDIQVNDTWKSPKSGAEYPSAWRVSLPSQGLTLQIAPLIPDQELNVSYAYWEGAVRIQGKRGEQTVNGFGYVELTGYAGPMGGEF